MKSGFSLAAETQTLAKEHYHKRERAVQMDATKMQATYKRTTMKLGHSLAAETQSLYVRTLTSFFSCS